ncbi:MAG: Zn-dependent hydrolase [Bacteroidales bacterium]|nr:Zn-dependent hydrolase [Bacteroidales bacterium]
MKNIFFACIALFLISCSSKNILDNMYKDYYGSYFKLGNDNKIKEFDITIKLTNDTIQIFQFDSLIYKGVYSFNDTSISLTNNTCWLSIDKEKETLTLHNWTEEPVVCVSYNELMKQKVAEYVPVQLTANVENLPENDKKLLSKLFEVAQIMDELFWEQVCPNKEQILNQITNEYAKKFFMINYGPYEHLRNNKPFIPGVPEHNPKATFYPDDMTKEEFEQWNEPSKTSWYTIIRRNNDGKLVAIPYSEFYKEKLSKAAQLLSEAASYADNPSLKKYLQERAQSFLTNDYFPSDMAWMDLTKNNIDFIAGPIENYTDEFLGYKTAFESFILLKDPEWSEKLARFATLLPQIQQNLPVPTEYKKEKPAKGNELGVYEAIFYAGDCNAGSKTIAINLPNDKKVNELKGSRKLQLKNIMKAKFDNILVPIAQQVIDEEQVKNIKFDAFFENVMFHEVAHGLGISKTIKDNSLVTDVLKETHTTIEEAKADILGLFIVTWLYENKHLTEHELIDNYVTFLAGIFRSVRFGASSSHGKANMIEFNYLKNKEAFTYNENTGKFKVNFDKMKIAIADLGKEILLIQGNGDYNKAKEMISTLAVIDPQLHKSLNTIAHAGIPRDIIFEQGKHLIKGLQ